MKEDLINLINVIPKIENLFHPVERMKGIESVYDIPEFAQWRLEVIKELQEINSRKEFPYILTGLEIFNIRMNGFNDSYIFQDMKGFLLSLQKEVDKYYTSESEINQPEEKEHKIFISHSSKDKNIADELTTLLSLLGLSEDNIFYSSGPGYDVPLDNNFLTEIRRQFDQYDLRVIILHSVNYYKSPICLNEMGIAWYLNCNITSILLPSFEFNDMAGVINNKNVAIKMDGDRVEVQNKLDQLREFITEDFQLSSCQDRAWISMRDNFIDYVNNNV